VALKSGQSEQAQQAALSHTASLAGSDAGAQAFLDRLGIARVHGLPEFLETLKLLHCVGPLASNRISSISCSGGEASLIADLAQARGVEFPPLKAGQKSQLKQALGPMVALANPLDYHTYIWRDGAKMAQAWEGMTGSEIALTLSIVDYPHTDTADWECATNAALEVRRTTGKPFAVVSTLPELMPQGVAQQLLDGGVVPMAGLHEALTAVRASVSIRPPDPEPVLLAGGTCSDHLMSERDAKAALADYGLIIPANHHADCAEAAGALAQGLNEPLVLKGTGLAHKSEHGAVRVGLTADQVAGVAREIATDGFLIEEMITGGVAELLVGVVQDPAHGFVLTIGAGGVLTEVMQDTVSLLIPATRDRVEAAIGRLKYMPVLAGYRGKPAAHMGAILDAVAAVQAYVLANGAHVGEIEINPLICTPDRAVAVDALIRKGQE